MARLVQPHHAAQLEHELLGLLALLAVPGAVLPVGHHHVAVPLGHAVLHQICKISFSPTCRHTVKTVSPCHHHVTISQSHYVSTRSPVINDVAVHICHTVLHQLGKTFNYVCCYLGPFGRETKTALVLETSFVHLQQHIEKILIYD